MIWWRGHGIWVLFIVGGVVLGSQIAFDAVVDPARFDGAGLPMGVSLLLAAAALWPFGQYTRVRQGAVLDGELALDVGHHSLFFIPVHFWTYIAAAGGVFLLVQQFLL